MNKKTCKIETLRSVVLYIYIVIRFQVNSLLFFLVYLEFIVPLEKFSLLQRATPTVTRGIRLYWSSPRTRDTHTYCRASGSGAVTTCFYDLRLPRPGFKHPTFRLRGERSILLRHRRGNLLANYFQVSTPLFMVDNSDF